MHVQHTGSSRSSRKDSVMEIPELYTALGMVVNRISPSSMDSDDSKYKAKEPSVILGPGQIHPKGYRLTSGRYGELKLGIIKIKGTVEVEVCICDRSK